MTSPLPDEVVTFAETVGPDSDEIVREMEHHAAETGFPIVGPVVGGWCSLLSRAIGARRVFEFGSGFGYSAYWFASTLPPAGEVILTEVDSDELDLARDFFEKGGLTDRAVFEEGDAIEIVGEYEGPFDVVLIDNEKDRYVEAFEEVREKVAPGGMVLADNAMRAAGRGGTVVDFDDLR